MLFLQIDDLLEHPYLAPHIAACKQRIASLESARLADLSRPTEPSPVGTTNPASVAPAVEPLRSEIQINGRACSPRAERGAPIRNSADSVLYKGDRGVNGALSEPAVLRSSADGLVRKSGGLEGFGPEPSSSPVVVIGNKRGPGTSDVRSLRTSEGFANGGPDLTGVESRPQGLPERSGEHSLSNGRGTNGEEGENGTVAARVQQLEALARRDSLWMPCSSEAPADKESSGGSTEQDSTAAPECSAQREGPSQTSLATRGGHVAASHRLGNGSQPGVKPQGVSTEISNGHSSVQTTANSELQSAPHLQTDNRLLTPGSGSENRSNGGKAAADSRQPMTGNNSARQTPQKPVAALSKAPNTDAASPLNNAGKTAAVKLGNGGYKKPVPAVSSPGVLPRTPSKSGLVSSASSTQTSSRTPLTTPKTKTAWGSSPATKPLSKPRTPLTEPKSSKAVGGGPNKRPASAPPKSSAVAAKKLTSATLPGRSQTAARPATGSLTRGTARNGLTATTERRKTDGKSFDFAAARKAAAKSRVINSPPATLEGAGQPEVSELEQPAQLTTILELSTAEGPVLEEAEDGPPRVVPEEGKSVTDVHLGA